MTKESYHSVQWTRRKILQDAGQWELSLLLTDSMKRFKGQQNTINSFAGVTLDYKAEVLSLIFFLANVIIQLN